MEKMLNRIDLAKVTLSNEKVLDRDAVVDLYRQNEWSSAEKPDLLLKALENSHSLVQAFYEGKLVGLGNAISDGFLVVYYPHMLVLPAYQGMGIGRLIMDRLQENYKDFHQQMLTADGRAVDFYKKCGFERAGQTEPMWIYQGGDH